MRKLGLRIILGYLVLTATLCVAVWFIVKSARAVSEVSDVARVVASQRKASNKLFAQLFESNTLGETATLQYASDRALRRYLESVAHTERALETLQSMTVNEAQLARLDTLSWLLNKKCKGVMNLVQTLRHENQQGTDLAEQIEALRSGRKPMEIGTQVSIPVVEHDEEVVIERRKKKFFQRLGDVFRKGKNDTLMTTTSTRNTLPDSAQAKVDISDTLANILTDVHRDLTRHSQARSLRVSRQTVNLRQSSAELSRRMALLLEIFTQEQQELMAYASQQERLRRTQAAWQMGAVALLATLAALVLFVWVGRDMSRANRYRKALEQAKEDMEKLMKRREQLLLTISHDIKAPVNTLQGYLSLLQPHTAPTAQPHLEAMEASAHHLLHLVTALLDYHKLEAGGITVQQEPTDLQRLLQSVYQAFVPLAEQKGLKFSAEWDLPQALTLHTDGFRLRQILENLLSNALKYTQSGEVTLRATCSADEVKMAVRDTGCGLSRYDCERIFTPFTRVKGSEGQEGTGLGLSITQKLAELLQGSLNVRSEIGVGSTFTLTLPRQGETATADEPTEGEKAQPMATESLAPPTRTTQVPVVGNTTATHAQTLVVVDDDALQIRLTEAMLRNVAPDKATILTFLTTDDFFAWLGEGHLPDMLFTDIEMPGCTGYEVLAFLRKREGGDHIPVIATTSHALIPAEDFKQRGFTEVLFKPFTQNDLRRVLSLTLASQEEQLPSESPTKVAPFAPLLFFAEGDPEAEKAILLQFRQDCETHLERLQQAVQRQDKATVCQLAHKLLPTFTLIQSPVVPALQLLEHRRAETEWTTADNEPVKRMLLELEACRKKLQAWLEAQG